MNSHMPDPPLVSGVAVWDNFACKYCHLTPRSLVRFRNDVLKNRSPVPDPRGIPSVTLLPWGMDVKLFITHLGFLQFLL